MKKNKFKQTWKTQTELGAKYGLSAIAVGKILKKHSLKNDDNTPTTKAIEEGYVHVAKDTRGIEYYLWNVKTRAFLGNENPAISIVDQAANTLEKEYRKIKREMKDPEKELFYDKFGPDIVDSIWEGTTKKLSKEQISELKEKVKGTDGAHLVPQNKK